MNKKVYTLKEIIDICTPILKKYNIKKAYIFGSYARGEATEKSDIDIMIKTTDSNILSLLNLSSLEIELEEKLEKVVDIVIEETYTDEINNEDIYGTLAKKIFYKEVVKDRSVVYD